MGSDTAIGARMIETACGLFIDPLDPDPAAFRLNDIAHSLSLVCRFQGHTIRHYSVAEHSMLVADVLHMWGFEKKTVLTGLMHDASEAYMADLCSPLKRDGFGDAFRAAENRLMQRLAERFGFIWPLPEAVHAADELLLWCEAHALMHSRGTTWGNYDPAGRQAIEDYPDVCQWVADGRQRLGDERERASRWMICALDMGAL